MQIHKDITCWEYCLQFNFCAPECTNVSIQTTRVYCHISCSRNMSYLALNVSAVPQLMGGGAYSLYQLYNSPNAETVMPEVAGSLFVYISRAVLMI